MLRSILLLLFVFACSSPRGVSIETRSEAGQGGDEFESDPDAVVGGAAGCGSDAPRTGGFGGQATAEAGAAGAPDADASASGAGGDGAGDGSPVIIHVIDWLAQSNGLGFPGVVVPPPPGIPLSSVLLWNHSPTKVASGEENWGGFRTLRARDSGQYGSELTFSLALAAAGRRHAHVKVTQGSTSMDDWRAADPEHVDLHDKWATAMTGAKAALAAAYPNATFVYWLKVNQGENDAGSMPAATGWPAQFATVKANREAVIGQPYAGVLVTLTRADQYDPTIVAALRASQASVADAVADMNGLSNTGVHLDGAGYNTLGEREAAAFLDLLNSRYPMGTLSNFSDNTLLNHVRNKQAYTPAANHYLHLYAASSVPLTSGNSSGYAAVAKTVNTTTWPNATARTKSSGVAWTFPTPTGTWLDVVEWRLTDSPTEGQGNILASNTHSAVPVNVSTGPLSYGVGVISIVFPTGGFVDAVVHGLADLMFGGTAYAPLTTTHGAWTVGDAQLGGTQVGSRVAMTQATTHGAASGGVCASIADITLAHQVTGTFWAEYDAPSNGNLLYTASRPVATGTGGVILAGQLRTRLT